MRPVGFLSGMVKMDANRLRQGEVPEVAPAGGRHPGRVDPGRIDRCIDRRVDEPATWRAPTSG
jgi:hypothetical protein